MTDYPLFPLSSIVMPGGLLPLRLFERRYLDMVTECFRNGTGFGVCLLKNGQEAGGDGQPYPRGTSVSIIDFDQGSDGLLNITAQGDQEFFLDHYLQQEDGLFLGEVRFIDPSPRTPMSPDYEELPLSPPSKMELLEMPSNVERLEALASMRIEISS